MKVIRNIYDWMGSKVGSAYADAWLIALFFIESSFFIIPVDPLLILYCISNTKRSLYYAAIATMASVAGGIFGYFIGSVMWYGIGQVLVKWLISEKTFYDVVAKYKLYQNWAVLLAGFTPIPYKAVTISAGFCNLAFVPFVTCSILARGARFFLIAGAIKMWGPQIKDFINQYFNYLVVAFTLMVILSLKVLVWV